MEKKKKSKSSTSIHTATSNVVNNNHGDPSTSSSIGIILTTPLPNQDLSSPYQSSLIMSLIATTSASPSPPSTFASNKSFDQDCSSLTTTSFANPPIDPSLVPLLCFEVEKPNCRFAMTDLSRSKLSSGPIHLQFVTFFLFIRH